MEAATSAKESSNKDALVSPTKQAIRRVATDFQQLATACLAEDPDLHMEVCLVDVDDLFRWKVLLQASGFGDCPIGKQLREAKIPGVLLELKFPNDFPFHPPFVRIMSPVLVGGFVLPFGGLCMEALSTSGWVPATRAESLLQGIRAQMIVGDIQLGMDQSKLGKYTEDGATYEFAAAMALHKW